jgi:hypothetical protein
MYMSPAGKTDGDLEMFRIYLITEIKDGRQLGCPSQCW